MEDATKAIDQILSHLGTLLRYFAPGFAALFIVAGVFQASRPFFKTQTIAAVVLATVLGPAIYGIHKVLLFIPLALIILVHKCCGSKTPKEPVLEVMKSLDQQRWMRRSVKGKTVITTIQGELDMWSEMLNYIYCLSYAMIVIPAVGPEITDETANLRKEFILVGVALLAVALISEFRITGRELEIRRDFPQDAKVFDGKV